MRSVSQPHIPFFEEINDFLAATKVPNRTKDPLFYCMRLQKHETKIFMPPFKRGFYFVGLINTKNETTVTYNNKNEAIPDSFIAFQSPNLLYSFYTSPETSGYLIYFKAACFDFFKPDIQTEFLFFDLLNTSFFHLDGGRYEQLAARFQTLFQPSDVSDGHSSNRVNALKLLALLYELTAFPTIADTLIPDKKQPLHLVSQFIQQVNLHYLEKRSVGQYAEMLAVSEDHLAKSVKQETGKTAYAFIVDRTIREARSLIAFTDMTYSEIAYHLGFSDASNFSKYFKRTAGLSPTAYRNAQKAR